MTLVSRRMDKQSASSCSNRGRAPALPEATMFSDDGRSDDNGHSDDDRPLGPGLSLGPPRETGNKRSASLVLQRPTKRCGVTRCPEDAVLDGRLDATQQHELNRWPQEMADWVGHLEAAISLRRSRLGTQIRALKVAAGFAGLGSHTQVLRVSGCSTGTFALQSPNHTPRCISVPTA